ncbi:hypothetical protein [Xylanivirga thermophila]|uniref:hypothetical protein n=1 Tax=Xylanivirga thermophila TaxID=2496273 RepID=UPI0039F5B449
MGRVTLQYGPIIYCLEKVDNGLICMRLDYHWMYNLTKIYFLDGLRFYYYTIPGSLW